MFGDADAADRAAGSCDLERGDDRLVKPDALEHRVGAEPAGEFADPLDCLVAALADDVGGAKLLPERNALGVVAEQDDLLGAEPLRCDHAAEADGAVTDDRDRCAGSHVGRDSGVVAGSHHVG